MNCSHDAVKRNGQPLCAGTMVAASGGGLILHGGRWGDAGHQHQFPHPGQGNAVTLGSTHVSHSPLYVCTAESPDAYGDLHCVIIMYDAVSAYAMALDAHCLSQHAQLLQRVS